MQLQFNFCWAIHLSVRASSRSRGSVPPSSISSWKARRLNLLPNPFWARSRSSRSARLIFLVTWEWHISPTAHKVHFVLSLRPDFGCGSYSAVHIGDYEKASVVHWLASFRLLRFPFGRSGCADHHATTFRQLMCFGSDFVEWKVNGLYLGTPLGRRRPSN